MHNNTQLKAVLLMVLCTVFTASGQILWKFGVGRLTFANLWTFLNIPFVLGFVSYGIGAVLMITAFRRGELSILYPIVATSYVWVSLLSPVLFPGDYMNALKWAGVLTILFAVSILGLGSSRAQSPPISAEGDSDGGGYGDRHGENPAAAEVQHG